MTTQHGGDIYRNDVAYDFSVNINPLGIPPKVRYAAQQAICKAEHYPDTEGDALCEAISESCNILQNQILLGNGAAELIYALCHAVRPKKVLLPAPCFLEYEAAAQAAGAECIFWNLDEKNNFCMTEEILSIITKEIDLLFLCNPNNPTGQLISKQMLCAIAQKCQKTNTCLCLDECFLPFLENEEEYTMQKELTQFPQMVILRAFTKIYAMPGLRLGYALVADENLRKKIRAQLQPWNTSIPAQMAGIEALKEKNYLAQTRKIIAGERKYLTEQLRSGLAEKVYDGAANYILFQSVKNLDKLLLKEKILIRSCANYRNLSDTYYRIGIRTHEENEELIHRLRRILWQKQS
jgi:threonine-phosphate decarboxylase